MGYHHESISIKFDGKSIFIIDQQLLPHEERWIDVTTADQMILAIKTLKVRGAPLIGVSAALALGLEARKGYSKEKLLVIAQSLKNARPTAVNLMNAIDRLTALIAPLTGKNPDPEKILQEAYAICIEDFQLCEAMATHGEKLISSGDNIITHCNTGGLATAGLGTALGVIIQAHQNGKKLHVYVDETRPLLQGARLTAWELQKHEIPHTLITDNMAAFVMQRQGISKVFVGADRIAVNGDFANKIGTYFLAIASKYHGVDFYCVAPFTTFDPKCPTGKEIQIEERGADEVLGFFNSAENQQICWSPERTKVYNPAFDVTPHELVKGFVTENGVVFKPSHFLFGFSEHNPQHENIKTVPVNQNIKSEGSDDKCDEKNISDIPQPAIKGVKKGTKT